jgi:hypothetical protein
MQWQTKSARGDDPNEFAAQVSRQSAIHSFAPSVHSLFAGMCTCIYLRALVDFKKFQTRERFISKIQPEMVVHRNDFDIQSGPFQK